MIGAITILDGDVDLCGMMLKQRVPLHVQDDPAPSTMSGVKLFFLLLLGVLVCIGCVVIGQYQTKTASQSENEDLLSLTI